MRLTRIYSSPFGKASRPDASSVTVALFSHSLTLPYEYEYEPGMFTVRVPPTAYYGVLHRHYPLLSSTLVDAAFGAVG